MTTLKILLETWRCLELNFLIESFTTCQNFSIVCCAWNDPSRWRSFSGFASPHCGMKGQDTAERASYISGSTYCRTATASASRIFVEILFQMSVMKTSSNSAEIWFRLDCSACDSIIANSPMSGWKGDLNPSGSARFPSASWDKRLRCKRFTWKVG